MKKSILYFFLFIPLTTLAQSKISFPVKFSSFQDKADTLGTIEIISFKDREYGVAYGSIWLLYHKVGYTEKLGFSEPSLSDKSGVPLMVDSVYSSSDYRYLAVQSSTEGATVIEVVDLQHLISKAEYKVLHTINPYPGWLKLKEWKGNKVMFDCNIAIDKIPVERRGVEDIQEELKSYIFDIKTGKVTLQ